MFTQKLILGYGTKIAMQFVQIVASIVVARVAGPSVLGTVAFGLAFVSMFVFLADLGTGTAHTKLVSEGRDLGTCIATYTRIKTALNILFFITVLTIFLAQKFVFHIHYESAAHEYVILIYLASLMVEQFLFIPNTTFIARTEQAKSDIPLFIKEIFHQTLRIVIVLLGYRAVALALGNLASMIFIIPFVYILYRGYPRGSFDRSLARDYFHISLPVLFIGLSTNVLGHIDKVVLQYFTDSEQVGYYTAGYRIGSLVLMVAHAVGALLFPYFSRAAAQGDFQSIKDKIDTFERFSFLFIMPAVIFLSIYSDLIIRVVLGEEYLRSVPIMMIINIAMFIAVLNMPYGNVLSGMGYFKLAAVISLSNLGVFIVLLMVLPNPGIFGLNGVGIALAVLISQFLLGIVHRVFAKKKCMILNVSSGIRFMLFGVVNFFTFYYLYNALSIRFGMPIKLAFIPAYFIITYLIFAVLGWIDKEDLNFIKMLMNIKKLGKYIRDELREQR